MAGGVESLISFIDRLVTEADLWDRFAADPVNTAITEGVEVSAPEVKQLLSIAGATDHELLWVIKARLKHLHPPLARSLLEQCTIYLFPEGLPPEQPRPRQRSQTGLPLGARLEAGLTAGQLAALRKLESFDLRPVQAHLSIDGTLPPVWLEEATFEFRRYLGMRLVFGRTFPMFSEQVDEVWHASLLFTDLYAELCQQVFGYFAYHDPWDEPKPGQIADLWRAFAEAYWALYGEPGYLWTIRSPAGAALALDGRGTLQTALGGAGHDT